MSLGPVGGAQWHDPGAQAEPMGRALGRVGPWVEPMAGPMGQAHAENGSGLRRAQDCGASPWAQKQVSESNHVFSLFSLKMNPWT